MKNPDYVSENVSLIRVETLMTTTIHVIIISLSVFEGMTDEMMKCEVRLCGSDVCGECFHDMKIILQHTTYIYQPEMGILSAYNL